MDEDDQMAAEAHQQELEARRAEEDAALERARVLQQELRDSIRLYDEWSKSFWDNLRLYEQERRNGDHG